MAEKKQPQAQPEIKHFNLIVLGDKKTMSGNMTLNEVAAELVTIAMNAGYNQAKSEKKEEDITK